MFAFDTDLHTTGRQTYDGPDDDVLAEGLQKLEVFDNEPKQLHEKADMIVVYSTVPG